MTDLERLEAILEHLVEHDAYLERRFDALEVRIDHIGRRLDTIAAQLHALTQLTTKGERSSLEAIGRRLGAIEVALHRLAPEPPRSAL